MTSVLSEPRDELLEVTCWGEAQGKQSLSKVLAGCDVCRALGWPWAAPWRCKAFPWLWDVSLGFQPRYLAERAANVGHLKPSMGSDSFRHSRFFWPRGSPSPVPDSAAASLFLLQISLLIFDRYVIFSTTLNLFLAASEESYSSYWFLVLRILTRVSVFVWFFIVVFCDVNTLPQSLYDGANIFGNNPLLGRDFKKLWFQLNFSSFWFFSYLKWKATAIYTKKKASALAPGKTLGRESRLNKWGFYIISVCIWYIDQYLYKFNLLFSW